MENNINIDLRGFFEVMNSRSGLHKSKISKTIRIQLDNYTLVIHGFINGVQLPSMSRETHTCRSAFNSDWSFNTYNESISDLELRFSVEYIEIETPDGETKSYNEIDGNSFRVINEILKAIR